MQKSIIRWIAPFLWMGVIFIGSSLSLLPGPADPFLNTLVKKMGHMVEYGILIGLWMRAFETTERLKANKWFLAGLVSSLYAFSDEWHQSLVLGRHPSLIDVGIDILGMLLVYWGWRWWVDRRLEGQ